jgi:hypothetical protein
MEERFAVESGRFDWPGKDFSGEGNGSKMTGALPWLVTLLGGLLLCQAGEVESGDWAYIDNGQVRLGVKKSSGACIGYFGLSKVGRNLLNHFDQGRFVQQSYYGDPDGTFWSKQPWRWNPVQGGDYKGNPAKLLELKSEPTTLYACTEPRHWSGCEALTNVVIEEWITLTGTVAHVRFKMSYSGGKTNQMADQEIPAVFVEPEFSTLVLYDGKLPWSNGEVTRSQPGWPNESRAMTEHWAAYVDTNDFGIGAYVPVATNLTCYRYGKGSSQNGACAYFAPLTRFAITPGFKFDYDLYLTIGKSEEIRKTFEGLRK